MCVRMSKQQTLNAFSYSQNRVGFFCVLTKMSPDMSEEVPVSAT